MRQTKRIIYVILTLWSTVSCSDFLEEKSQDEVIPSTVDDYREILLGYQKSPFSQAILVLDDDVQIDESRLTSYPNPMLQMLMGTLTWQPDIWEEANSLMSYYDLMYRNIMAMNDGGNYTSYVGTYNYPEGKYYDKYSFGTSSSQIIRSKLGDGIKEVLNTSSRSWYSDYSNLAYSGYPWFNRSGGYNDGSNAGAFYSGYHYGFASAYNSSRLVITP